MDYYTDLFTVETYEGFLASDRTVSGFRENQMGMTKRIKPGDKLLIYIKGLSRWAGVLEVNDGPFVDHSPLFLPENDPFVVRFHVKAAPALPLDQAIPIREKSVFDKLTFTCGKEDGYWLGPLRRSLQHMEVVDGRYLEQLLSDQSKTPKPYPLDTELEFPTKSGHGVKGYGLRSYSAGDWNPSFECRRCRL